MERIRVHDFYGQVLKGRKDFSHTKLVGKDQSLPLERIYVLNSSFESDSLPLCLDYIRWSGISLPGIELPAETSWSNARVWHSNFYDASMQRNYLENTSYWNSHLLELDFTRSKMVYPDFRFCNLTDIVLTEVEGFNTATLFGSKKGESKLAKFLHKAGLFKGIRIQRRG